MTELFTSGNKGCTNREYVYRDQRSTQRSGLTNLLLFIGKIQKTDGKNMYSHNNWESIQIFTQKWFVRIFLQNYLDSIFMSVVKLQTYVQSRMTSILIEYQPSTNNSY